MWRSWFLTSQHGGGGGVCAPTWLGISSPARATGLGRGPDLQPRGRAGLAPPHVWGGGAAATYGTESVPPWVPPSPPRWRPPRRWPTPRLLHRGGNGTAAAATLPGFFFVHPRLGGRGALQDGPVPPLPTPPHHPSGPSVGRRRRRGCRWRVWSAGWRVPSPRVGWVGMGARQQWWPSPSPSAVPPLGGRDGHRTRPAARGTLRRRSRPSLRAPPRPAARRRAPPRPRGGRRHPAAAHAHGGGVAATRRRGMDGDVRHPLPARSAPGGCLCHVSVCAMWVWTPPSPCSRRSFGSRGNVLIGRECQKRGVLLLLCHTETHGWGFVGRRRGTPKLSSCALSPTLSSFFLFQKDTIAISRLTVS